MSEVVVKRIWMGVFAAAVLLFIAHNQVLLKSNRYVDCLQIPLKISVNQFNHVQTINGGILGEVFRCFFSPAEPVDVYQLLSVVFFKIFGVSEDVSLFGNYVYLLILLFSVYRICVLIKDEYLGLIAVFQLLMFPGVFGFTRLFFLPIATMSLVALAMYALLSSKYFTDTRKNLLLLLCCVLLLKLKFEKSFVYLFVPFVLYVWQAIAFYRHDGKEQKKIWRNLIDFLVLGGLIICLMFGTELFAPIFEKYIVGVRGVCEALRVHSGQFSILSVFVYLKDLMILQAGTFGFFLFCVGLVVSLKNGLDHKLILASWFIIPYVFYTAYYCFLGIHASYYTLEYLPVVAIGSAYAVYWVFQKSRGFLRILVCVLFVGLNILNYVTITYLNRQLPLFNLIRPASFMGKAYLKKLSLDEEGVLQTTQALIDKIWRVKGRVSVVFINHYPVLGDVLRQLEQDNVARNDKVQFYAFSRKIFMLVPTDSFEILLKRMTKADLIINANRYYPGDRISILKNYKIYGSVYDFTGPVKQEEDAFNQVRDGFDIVQETECAKNKVTFLLNKDVQLKLNDAVEANDP